MERKKLIAVLVASLLGILTLAGTACGEGQAVAQPSFSYAAQPSLLNIGDFSLLEGRATHVLVRATRTHPLRIFIIADRPLGSVSLRRMAAADGSMAGPESIPLKGSPHDLGRETVYGLTTGPIEPGYFRLDLLGRGRVQSLVIKDW